MDSCGFRFMGALSRVVYGKLNRTGLVPSYVSFLFSVTSCQLYWQFFRAIIYIRDVSYLPPIFQSYFNCILTTSVRPLVPFLIMQWQCSPLSGCPCKCGFPTSGAFVVNHPHLYSWLLSTSDYSWCSEGIYVRVPCIGFYPNMQQADRNNRRRRSYLLLQI